MSFPPSSPDWMMLQCSACRTKLKVRREVALVSRLLCPSCHAAVDAGLTPAAAPALPSPEFSPTPLPDRPLPPVPRSKALPQRLDQVMQGQAFGGAGHAAVPPGGHADFDGSGFATPGPVTPADGGGVPGTLLPDRRQDPGEWRRVKIKKRRVKPPVQDHHHHELTDWDQQSSAALPEAESAADVWGQVPAAVPENGETGGEFRDYVVEVVHEPDGQTRTTRKRVRRRRLLKGARLAFRRVFSVSRYLAAALALAVAGVAVYGFAVFGKKAPEVVLPPMVELPIDRAVLTSYDEQGAEKAVRDFLAADGMEAKLAFVRQPERIRPLMKKWYRGGHTARPLQAGEVTLRDKRGGEPGSTAYYVVLALPVYFPDPLNPGGTYEENTFFAVEEIREGPRSTYLVDWETSTGYQEMPLETFKATMPGEPSPFRVYLKADSYYNHGFSEQDWQCVALYYPGRDFHLYGYINRNTLEGRALLPFVEDGRRAGIIAELMYPPDAASRDQVIVKRMLHPSWFYEKAEDAAVFGDPMTDSKPR